MATFSRIALAASLLAVTACTAVDRGMGEALKYDMALQTVDPDPVYAEGSTEAGTSGTTAAEAAKRYRTGAVKQVEVQTTTTTVSGGTGSNSSGPK